MCINNKSSGAVVSNAASLQEGSWAQLRHYGQGLSVRSLQVLTFFSWVLPKPSGFLPQFKDMQLVGSSQVVILNCPYWWMWVLMVICLYCVSDRQPVQGVPCRLPYGSWDRPQPPCEIRYAERNGCRYKQVYWTMCPIMFLMYTVIRDVVKLSLCCNKSVLSSVSVSEWVSECSWVWSFSPSGGLATSTLSTHHPQLFINPGLPLSLPPN